MAKQEPGPGHTTDVTSTCSWGYTSASPGSGPWLALQVPPARVSISGRLTSTQQPHHCCTYLPTPTHEPAAQQATLCRRAPPPVSSGVRGGAAGTHVPPDWTLTSGP